MPIRTLQAFTTFAARKSGIYRFIQFHLDLSGSITLSRAHEISDSVEEVLQKAFPNTEILIHQDPLHGDRRPAPGNKG